MKQPKFGFTRIIPLVLVLLALAAPVAGPTIMGSSDPSGNVLAQEIQDRDGDTITDAEDLCPDDPANQCEAAQSNDQSSGVAQQQDDSQTLQQDSQEPQIDDSNNDGVVQDEPPLDSDGDGFADVNDNCPTVANADQADSNSNGIGDACDAPDPAPVVDDADFDSVPDDIDNCPLISNLDQADSNGDGIGDMCAEAPPIGTSTSGDLNTATATVTPATDEMVLAAAIAPRQRTLCRSGAQPNLTIRIAGKFLQSSSQRLAGPSTAYSSLSMVWTTRPSSLLIRKRPHHQSCCHTAITLDMVPLAASK